jgi:hypothetical protein
MILPVSESHLPLHSEKKQSGISSLDTDKNGGSKQGGRAAEATGFTVQYTRLNQLMQSFQVVLKAFQKLEKTIKKRLELTVNTPYLCPLLQREAGSAGQFFSVVFEV